MISIQLINKQLIRPQKDEKLIKQKNGYGLWRKYTNVDGTPFYNKELSIKNEQILNIFI